MTYIGVIMCLPVNDIVERPNLTHFHGATNLGQQYTLRGTCSNV